MNSKCNNLDLFSINDINNSLQSGISTILPLFHEKAATTAMVKHAMDILLSIVEFCNPGQIPVMAIDLPIYAIGKQVQWVYPMLYGEDKFTLLLGGIHSEMASWSMIGRLLTDSGWTNIISEAGVATGGSSESLLYASCYENPSCTHSNFTFIGALTKRSNERRKCH